MVSKREGMEWQRERGVEGVEGRKTLRRCNGDDGQ
jgi:hypothetical protein